MDLITLARAKVNIPSAATADNATISTLITACSKAIQQYCQRDFTATVYDELYNGTGDRRLILRQYPIISVEAVRYRPVTVLKITNTLATNQQARVSVTSTGLTLKRIASGIAFTDTITFAANGTLNALAAAVNALGNGWSAQPIGDYGPWPSADLKAIQGALNAVTGVFAELKMHTFELSGYQIDERRGWLLRAIPYTDPELLHPEDLIWPVGINNFRIQYAAGFATIPEDVQEACAQWVAIVFFQTRRDPGYSQLKVEGLSYSVSNIINGLRPPDAIAALLSTYRQYRVMTNQG